jgi:Sec-independent protein translocase protein TatA
LPEVANALGKGLAEFKRAMNNVKEELKLDEVRNEVNEMKDSLLFKDSYLDEQKEEKKEPKSQAIESEDKKDDKAAADSHSQTPPSPQSDSSK